MHCSFKAKYDNKTTVQTSKSVQETKSPSNSFVQLVLISTDLQVRSYSHVTVMLLYLLIECIYIYGVYKYAYVYMCLCTVNMR